MLICGECNGSNNDGERFCSNCGAYLIWQRPQVSDSAQPSAMRTSEIGSGPSRATPTHLPPPPGRAPANAQGGQAASHSIGAQAATTDGEPATVQPGRRSVPAPGPIPPRGDSPLTPGDLVCGRCGAGNSPERNFCRRCGASLAEAVVAPRPPWWRRVFSSPPKRAPVAGTRPKRKTRRFPVRLVSFLVFLGIIGGGSYLGREAIAGAFVRVEDELTDVTVLAQGMTASSSANERSPELAIDGTPDRSWSAKLPGPDPVEILTAHFEKPFRLSYVIISGGASNVPEVFSKERWPVKVEITAVGMDERQTSVTVDLADVGTPQGFYVGADMVSRVELKILASKGPPDMPVAVSEVQFSGRR